MDIASCGECSDSIVELNIKTLDSQIYSFQVDKNTPVSSFKEKIAEEIGLPVAQQRLIFRGKVLKDEHPLSEYHVENGDTLHLVERQPAQSQPSSQPSSGEANVNSSTQGNDGNPGAPRNRIGQISHSVVLGTLNVGDQGEGVVPDLTRVIGAVLSSLGIGNQTASNSTQNFATYPASGQAPHGNEADAAHGNSGSQTQAQNPTQSGQSFPNPLFQYPLAGSSVPRPSIHAPIPDSLNTLCEFMNRMEGVLSRIGNPRDQSSPDVADQPSTQLPSNAGLPPPEAMGIVLRRAQQLLEGGASASLSHIAGHLEQELSSTDSAVRSQIQSELVQGGLAMQHLGALFLELGRTILTLRMGQSPVESLINAGPAVYISPQGPNPIMVQPFPLQTSPLFTGANSPPNPGSLGPVGVIGSVPRHINIHIHAGTALAPMVSPGLGEHTDAVGSGDSGSARVLRNVIATAMPHPAIGITSAPTIGPPVTGVSASQPQDSSPLTSLVAEINSQLRNHVSNLSAGNQQPFGQQEGARQNSSVGLGRGSDSEGIQETSEVNRPTSEVLKDQSEIQQDAANPSKLMQALPSSSSDKPRVMSENIPGGSTEMHDVPDAATSVPLGLGFGGLQPKRRTQSPKVQLKSDEGRTSGAISSQSPNAIAAGQQVLQSLASFRSSVARNPMNEATTRQIPQAPAMGMEGVRSGDQGSGGQPDMMGLMSQVLQNPAFNGILSGIAGQTGVGSADDMRNMFQQLTQDPDSRNTLNQFAQQVNREDLSNMFAGSGRTQDGAMDFSRMIQQMMPIVSRALSGGAAQTDSTVECDLRPEPTSIEQRSEIDIQEAVQRITMQSSSEDILRAVVQSSLRLNDGTGLEEVVDELSTDKDLVNEFMEVLRHDLQRRFQDGSE